MRASRKPAPRIYTEENIPHQQKNIRQDLQVLNQYIKSIDAGCLLEIKYNPFGKPVSIELDDNGSCVHIPIGSEHFSALLDHIKTAGINPIPDITWISLAKNSDRELLYYQTNIGNFVDAQNPISDHIRKLLSADKVEVRDPQATAPTISVEANVFLPRNYTISTPGSLRPNSFDFEPSSLGLQANIFVTLLQAIETDFFEGFSHAKNHIKHSNGNVLRIRFAGREMRSIYKWANGFLDEHAISSLTALQTENIALFKRGSRGPTTNWYLDLMVLNHYIWAPILEITNRVIDLMNRQAHRKTTSLLSRDDLGDVACLKIARGDGTSFVTPAFSLRDEQINIYPLELNQHSHPLVNSFQRVRFLLDRGLYFESVLVAQAALEGVINRMFPSSTKYLLFEGKEPKWEIKLHHLRDFILFDADRKWLTQGSMGMYLSGGLKEIYDLRNHYAHDALEKRPEYIYNESIMQNARRLLRPLTDTHENILFIRQVSALHALQTDFEDFLKNILNKAG